MEIRAKFCLNLESGFPFDGDIYHMSGSNSQCSEPASRQIGAGIARPAGTGRVKVAGTKRTHLGRLKMSDMDDVKSEDENECPSLERAFSPDDGAEKSQDRNRPNSSAQLDIGSDEDPAVVDEKKQKRMLSNRESARRSRLRKQQHLDEMKKQVSQLRSENTEMLTKFDIASSHYAQITEENRILRAHAMELSRRLQRLHHAAAAQGHPMSHDLGLGLAHMDAMSLQLSGAVGSHNPHGFAVQHLQGLNPHHPSGNPSAFHYPYPHSSSAEMSQMLKSS